MLSKNQIKRITSLQQKKFRQQEQCFTAEGVKVIGELLQSHFELEHLFETDALFPMVPDALKTRITTTELERITALHSANNCLAVFRMPTPEAAPDTGLIVALDDIRDPGNLGTIIRLCDWFGVDALICSKETAEVYNPKVVQATMGSIARVPLLYTDLPAWLEATKLPVFGTFMEGDNIYKAPLPAHGVIVLGNEANGISEAVQRVIDHKISIPRFGKLQQTESLNVATAAAIILSEFKRNG